MFKLSHPDIIFDTEVQSLNYILKKKFMFNLSQQVMILDTELPCLSEKFNVTIPDTGVQSLSN